MCSLGSKKFYYTTEAKIENDLMGHRSFMNQLNIELDSISFTPLTVNPLLSPPGGLFFSSTFEGGGGGGGLIERGELKREGGLI